MRRPRGDSGRAPGSRLITTAAVLLGLLAAGLFVVSLAAQYRYVLAEKHQVRPRDRGRRPGRRHGHLQPACPRPGHGRPVGPGGAGADRRLRPRQCGDELRSGQRRIAPERGRVRRAARVPGDRRGPRCGRRPPSRPGRNRAVGMGRARPGGTVRPAVRAGCSVDRHRPPAPGARHDAATGRRGGRGTAQRRAIRRAAGALRLHVLRTPAAGRR